MTTTTNIEALRIFAVTPPTATRPTPMCNPCAQSAAGEIPALVARIRALEAALGEVLDPGGGLRFRSDDVGSRPLGGRTGKDRDR